MSKQEKLKQDKRDREVFISRVKETQLYQETREYLIWCQKNGQNPIFGTSLINYRGVVRKCEK